ncbi:D-galactoside/L-rhamnose binding SUEL lectin domain-containing protein [Artemisia annua]|uniref:Beta-galactosidase n=1 Tax=Artemisia annua TaxID=35608 RepID=A0A2U1M221_ARTAN|nr:D-galactoside/L-rhamnose binding SUEL lectin domain-containing protein [Artemisia annua]
MMRSVTKMSFVMVLVVVMAAVTEVVGVNVTYDHRALVIDGKRRVLVSGSIHYPRSTPDYDFEGGKDLVRFVKSVADAGLYAHIRIGPYVCAEWNYGGFPLWLHFIPGIQLRTDNEPYKAEMKRFTAKIVSMLKDENLYASQGGPIILSQIENEYGNIDKDYGSAAQSYIKWAASMATSLNTGVPWVMCQQSDAPASVINTCNGFYCDGFTPNSKNKPSMWTENWTGWFLAFGGAVPYRPVEDIAFAVARFYQRGGTFQNYYMYHGGTNFGRTTGGPFISTSYDYDAPLDEYGQLRQPKWGHLRDLHKAIKLCEEAMVATDPKNTSLGHNLEAVVYKTSSTCAAFLANIDTKNDATVNYNGNSYHLPAWSVSILPDCKNVVYNTAKINSMATIRTFVPTSVGDEFSDSKSISSDWSYVSEPIGISSNNAFDRPGLLEQINTTADQSDYLWYSISTDIKGDEPFLNDASQTTIHVKSLGHVLHLFVNDQLEGSAFGNSGNPKISKDISITLKRGTNKIDLLSLTVGLQNYGAFFDKTGAGITGPVEFDGSKSGSTLDLSSQRWTYQIGLKGESLGLDTGDSSLWVSGSPKGQPLTWYKTNFDAPSGDGPLAIDFTGMTKGEAWVNGQGIGRYWPGYNAPTSGCSDCSYKGPYSSSKCLKNCGKPSQKLYHVPRSWLKPSGNVLVLLEEIGGDPNQISFATQELDSLCSHVSQSHPLPIEAWSQNKKSKSEPRVSLECPHPNQVISSIKFASFGTPQGKCGSFSHGECRSTKALSVLKKACVGSRSCSVAVTTSKFGDPCKNVLVKSLAVEASCA